MKKLLSIAALAGMLVGAGSLTSPNTAHAWGGCGWGYAGCYCPSYSYSYYPRYAYYPRYSAYSSFHYYPRYRSFDYYPRYAVGYRAHIVRPHGNYRWRR